MFQEGSWNVQSWTLFDMGAEMLLMVAWHTQLCTAKPPLSLSNIMPKAIVSYMYFKVNQFHI